MSKIYFNDGWQFTEQFTGELLELKLTGELESAIETVRLPHTCKELPFHYFDESEYQMVCGYRRLFTPQEEWKDKRIFLTLEGAAHGAVVYCNKAEAGSHACGYTAFTVELTNLLRFGEENVITVKLDTRESQNMPPFGRVIDYMTYGGLYRGAYLEIKPSVCLSDIFVKTALRGKDSAILTIENNLNGRTDGEDYELRHAYRKKGEEKTNPLGVQKPLEEVDFLISGIEPWDTEHPALYELVTGLYCRGECLEEKSTVFGIRECCFKKDGFYLNGRKIKLRGLNRHQSYPYVGYAMPDSIQRLDADIVKHELGLNAVRTSHYPQSQAFISRCDELGLLVFTEIPGWQYIGDEEWKAQAVKNVEEMIIQYRNHPSIILWGVRINESQDDDELYARTNETARSLDSTRPTGGVRVMKESSLLEDVYTFNDFSHIGPNPGLLTREEVTGGLDVPYLVSEYNGHMYPTKPFDDEEHRLSQALRHANVLETCGAGEDIAGCFGWCMFDYNTHQDFGSGDRICYHGVLDMFRNPKMAAAVYESQCDSHPVFEMSSSMEIGEHPGGNVGTIYVFTNADFVRIYKNEEYVGAFYPDRENYGHLPHPPIKLDDFVGELLETKEGMGREAALQTKEVLLAMVHYGQNLPPEYMAKARKLQEDRGTTLEDVYQLFGKYVGNWGGSVITYRVEAVKDGQVVKTIVKKPAKKVKLEAKVHRQKLIDGKTYDCGAVRIRAVDENKNLLNWFQEPVILAVTGELELIGPSVISLKGGQGGCYVKTTGNAGSGTLTVVTQQAEKLEIKFTVEKTD